MSQQRIVQAPKECPGPEVCAPVQLAPHGWHLKREIQLGHILSTLAIAASAAAYIVKMDQRLAVIEANMVEAVKYQSQRDQAQDESATRADALIRDQLKSIDAKLDRLIERSGLTRSR